MPEDRFLAHHLKDWGLLPNGDHPRADNFSCPLCRKFSFFCNGDFTSPASTRYRGSVVGFRVALSGDCAGIAVLNCPSCGANFTQSVSVASLGAYVDDCPNWGK
jgi:hypothetical protein